MTLAEVQTQFLTILHPKAAPPRLGHRGHVATVCVAREIRQRAVCYEGPTGDDGSKLSRLGLRIQRGRTESRPHVAVAVRSLSENLTATSSRRIEGVEQLLASGV